jgi:hypothetical protein
VGSGFASNPVISFSVAIYLAFPAGQDDISGAIGIPLDGYTNNWPKGALFQNPFGTAPRMALYHFATMVGLVSFLCPRRFFNPFINAESMVSTLNNTIEVKVYIHECIFWGCSVDTFGKIIWQFLIIK